VFGGGQGQAQTIAVALDPFGGQRLTGQSQADRRLGQAAGEQAPGQPIVGEQIAAALQLGDAQGLLGECRRAGQRAQQADDGAAHVQRRRR
jgi:hypothetical protein